jgi:DtxR family Mn-dependent transcriptional regulator
MKTSITSHLEDYLEAILLIAGNSGEAHASAVAEKMGVTRASVTGALRALAERKLITYHPYQPVVLTDEGRQVARACADRHQFLHQFFRDQLGMENSEAEAVACKVEHVASATVLSRMAEFSRYLTECQEIELSWDLDGTLRCAREPMTSGCSRCQRRRPALSD